MSPAGAAAAGAVRDGHGAASFLRRLWALVVKEFIQMRRDRLTFAMMVSIPLMQLVLFGYAIDTDPRHMPTALLAQDHGRYARAVIAAVENTGYFEIVARPRSEAELDALIRAGRVQFGLQIPGHFGRDVVRGDRPAILVVADATDPVATGAAAAALGQVGLTALRRELVGPTGDLAPAAGSSPGPFETIVHRRYNPAGETSLNIVPGLLGTVLTLSMLIFTALAVTREVERGTMETLLAMPVRPVEVMLGKIVPYILAGILQAALILAAAVLVFRVPMAGSLALLGALSALFLTAMLAVGYTFSTIARNQLQALQMAFFFFLPNLLLSGFMFPFGAMPRWAQVLGEILPLTHYLRIVRAIMLKGAGPEAVWRDAAALGLFTLLVMAIAVLRYRRTLD